MGVLREQEDAPFLTAEKGQKGQFFDDLPPLDIPACPSGPLPAVLGGAETLDKRRLECHHREHIGGACR